MTQQNTMPELKPCPFCGKTEYIPIKEHGYWTGMRTQVTDYELTHWCSGNPVHGLRIHIMFPTKDGLIKSWNNRTPDHTDLLKQARDALVALDYLYNHMRPDAKELYENVIDKIKEVLEKQNGF